TAEENKTQRPSRSPSAKNKRLNSWNAARLDNHTKTDDGDRIAASRELPRYTAYRMMGTRRRGTRKRPNSLPLCMFSRRPQRSIIDAKKTTQMRHTAERREQNAKQNQRPACICNRRGTFPGYAS